MSIIDFFGHHIKPRRMRGTGCLNPAPTGAVSNHVFAIRQMDVNFWLYRKGDTIIAFDCGYRDGFLPEGWNKPVVSALFLTHADMDHAGGLMSHNPPFSTSMVYLHQDEEAMLLGQEKRFRFGPVQLKNPIKYQGTYHVLKDCDTVRLGDIRVEILHAPGHTPGHSCYLVDDSVLFSGDCMAMKDGEGYAFFDFFNMNTQRNMESLRRLKARFSHSPPALICTGHSGYAHSPDAFAHIDVKARGSKKQPFDPSAPMDAFA